MTQYTLQEKVQFTEHIVNEVNKFWIKHKGELFNHKDFWDETLHSFTNEDWTIMLDVKAFKALMNIKDVFINFTGYEAPTRFAKDPEPPTPFEQLFDY